MITEKPVKKQPGPPRWAEWEEWVAWAEWVKWETFRARGSMPIYEYYCASCKEGKEILQKISDPVLSLCPDCHKGPFSKKISRSFGLQFTGTGFYETDYKKTVHEPLEGVEKGSCSGSCSSCPSPCGCGGEKKS